MRRRTQQWSRKHRACSVYDKPLPSDSASKGYKGSFGVDALDLSSCKFGDQQDASESITDSKKHMSFQRPF